MGKSNLLKDGMKGGLNGLLSSTKSAAKEAVAPPRGSKTAPVHCNFLINKDLHKRMKYLAIQEGISLRDIVNQAMLEYLERHEK